MNPDGLTLLHLDEWLVAVDKPTGMLSVPGRGADKADCVARRVQAAFPDALIVHRLDMGTSGVLVFGRGAAAQRAREIPPRTAARSRAPARALPPYTASAWRIQA